MSAERTIARNGESGAALLEFTVVVMVFLLVLFGTVEFSYLFYQWNAATKAVQFGARLAAVSPPVSSDLSALTGMEGGTLPGGAMEPFNRACVGATGVCSGGTYSATAMQTLVYGRGNTVCVNPPQSQLTIGMCNLFWRITPQNVTVSYNYTGLGYAGRPGGPVPTITVELSGLTFQYIFLNGLVPGLSSKSLPGFRTTMTGEDLGNGV